MHNRKFYNWFLEFFLLPIGDWMLGTNYIRELRRWRNIQWFSDEKLQKTQQHSLQKLLMHAVEKVPYYRDLSIQSEDNPVAWLKKFPILYKSDIKANIGKMVLGNSSTLVKEVSSGSSGIQVEVYMSKLEASSTQALQTLLWEWAGYRLGKPLLQLGMTTTRGFVKRLKDIVLRTNYQQAFNLNSIEASEVLSSIKGNEVFFGGYASGLYAYALLAKEPVTFKSVISWGDKMFEHYRSRIESVFKSRVFDTYGCTEGFVIAGQCEEGNYHILSPHIKLELVNSEGREVEPGELGYVVVTRLDGYSMPLIRYYLGDLAIKEDPAIRCLCGRSLPMLKQIIGRDTDIVKTRSGKMLIVHFFTGILEHFPSIRQFRIVQYSLDEIVLEYIPESHIFTHDVLDAIHNVIQSKAQEDLKINFKEVEVIEPTASGKPQIIKSMLD